MIRKVQAEPQPSADDIPSGFHRPPSFVLQEWNGLSDIRVSTVDADIEDFEIVDTLVTPFQRLFGNSINIVPTAHGGFRLFSADGTYECIVSKRKDFLSLHVAHKPEPKPEPFLRSKSDIAKGVT